MKEKQIVFIDTETISEEELIQEDAYESNDEGLQE